MNISGYLKSSDPLVELWNLLIFPSVCRVSLVTICERLSQKCSLYILEWNNWCQLRCNENWMFLLHHWILKMRVINAITSNTSIPANGIIAFVQWKGKSQSKQSFWSYFWYSVSYVDRGPKPSRLKMGIVSNWRQLPLSNWTIRQSRRQS